MIVSLALSPSLDITYEVPALRHGDITRPSAVTRVAGGKSLNVARVAQALGADVRAVAALGGHTGAWITEMLTAAEIDVDVVRLSAPTRICSAIVEAGENPTSTDLYEPATPLSPMEWQRFTDAALGVSYGPATWVVVAGSLPQGVRPQDVVALVETLRRRGARLAVDSSGEGLRVLAGHADLLKINRVEAGRASGQRAAGRRGRREESRFAARLRRRGHRRGARGIRRDRWSRLSPRPAHGAGTISGGQRRRLSRRPSCRTRFRTRAHRGSRPGARRRGTERPRSRSGSARPCRRVSEDDVRSPAPGRCRRTARSGVVRRRDRGHPACSSDTRSVCST